MNSRLLLLMISEVLDSSTKTILTAENRKFVHLF